MKTCLTLLGLFLSASAFGIEEKVNPVQSDYERSINAVVRAKNYYKTGKFEIAPAASVMPFDSLIAHYMLGGRVTWHFSDHFSWEVVDLHLPFPSVTSYTKELVQSNSIGNLQATELKLIAGTNLIISPFYGKIRLFSESVLHFDIYAIFGGGVASVRTLKFASASGAPTTQSVAKTGLDPMLDFGLGFKMFFNRAMGLVVDFRDYVTYSTTYDKKSLRSNFAVTASLAFFLPTF